MPSSELVPLPSASELNPDLNPLGPAKLTAIFGKPRSAPLPPHVAGGPCFPVTNKKLDGFIVRRKVSPFFSVTGLQPAVDSLAEVLDEIKALDPALHSGLGTAGMLCVRRIANSTTTSNHSWGTAVDLRVDNMLNIVGNDKAIADLLTIAPIFTRHKWYWGAEFPHEDSMHFEVSLEKMQGWVDEGRFTRDPILQHGHFGTKVAELQNLLNKAAITQPALAVDSDFGDKTLAAVEAFQAARGLEVDAIVGKLTWTALRS